MKKHYIMRYRVGYLYHHHHHPSRYRSSSTLATVLLPLPYTRNTSCFYLGSRRSNSGRSTVVIGTKCTLQPEISFELPQSRSMSKVLLPVFVAPRAEHRNSKTLFSVPRNSYKMIFSSAPVQVAGAAKTRRRSCWAYCSVYFCNFCLCTEDFINYSPLIPFSCPSPHPPLKR